MPCRCHRLPSASSTGEWRCVVAGPAASARCACCSLFQRAPSSSRAWVGRGSASSAHQHRAFAERTAFSVKRRVQLADRHRSGCLPRRSGRARLQTYAIFGIRRRVPGEHGEPGLALSLRCCARQRRYHQRLSVAGSTPILRRCSYAQTFGGAFIDTTPYPTTGNCSQTTRPPRPVCMTARKRASCRASSRATISRAGSASCISCSRPTLPDVYGRQRQLLEQRVLQLPLLRRLGRATVLYAAIPFTRLTARATRSHARTTATARSRPER